MTVGSGVAVIRPLSRENITSVEIKHSESVVSDESNRAPLEMPMDEILERIGTHGMQWVVLSISAFSYSHFALQTMIPTLSVHSLRARWTHLKDAPVVFNSVFAAAAFARLVGSLCLLPLLDRFGRRNFLMLALGASVLCSCAAALSPDFYTYVTLRGITILIASVLPAAAVIYSVELVSTGSRSTSGMLCQALGSIMIVYGTLMAGAVGAQTENADAWRWVTVVCCVPTILPIIGLAYLWVETPRFLIAVKRDTTKTWRTLKRMTGSTRALHDRLLGYEDTTEPTLASISDKIVIKGVVDSEDATTLTLWQEIKGTIAGMWSLLKQREHARLTANLALTWGLQSFSHWGLSAYMTLFYSYIGVNVTWTTAASFIIELPSQVILCYLMDSKFGRIGSAKLYASLCSLAHLVLSLVLGLGISNQTLLMILAMLCFFFGGPLWGVIYTYSVERYPTTLRSSAMALFSATNAMAAIATTYIGSVSLDASRTWMYPLLWGSLRLGIVMCALFWSKDTAKADLEDRAESSS
eukprot:Blabericola_migrator_1__40@NODE_100_length_14362_cov_139_136341_g85_i1_p3_GENE_NODE_100_length_14362_cov_139_136341_g85_i1NODE_100_length_14362_cov_139_136341_g85_i1_p3_ORF_typecomplete_len526_score48_56Sugar_tr/PF00083_24/7_3e45MFS_1/PF07690_16/8_4e02MFS_1/PF07690_16/1_7e17MFS_1/PF07690_16/4_2e08TRI12/PF06609_13/1_1e07TRI12/PF06609_13/65MFS_1_like/PF12832_7/3_2e07MFS_2/PF13347_6/0_0025MFS_2/PF13347_6/0_25MFS_2/PF13347_6/0_027MFS_2/PF13347_6/2_9e02MFS_3/PF05977_13/2_7e05MFS_3/PF05977_13/1_1e03MF